MLINKEFHDIPSALDGGRPIRVFVISPVVPNYPQAKFPGKEHTFALLAHDFE
jgi:carboxymethylenebutenolidase